MSTMKQRVKLVEDLGPFGFWKNWMSHAQRVAIANIVVKSDEREWFIERLGVLHARISSMPETYDNEGVDDPVAHLKYFGGPVTAYITEKDCGDDGEWQLGTEQVQAFGRIEILPNYPELGYISIQELTEAGAELDLHFEPTPISQIKAKEL